MDYKKCLGLILTTVLLLVSYANAAEERGISIHKKRMKEPKQMGAYTQTGISYKRPADVMIPARIKTVALENRYDPKGAGKVLRVVEGFFTNESIGQDTKARTAALIALRTALDESPRFSLNPELIELRHSDLGSDILKPEEVITACAEHGLDGLITIDGFDSNLSSLPSDPEEMAKHDPRTLSVTLVVRIYDGESGLIFDTFNKKNWGESWGRDRKEVARKLGEKAADNYVDHLKPYRQGAPRPFFRKGSELLEKGEKLSKERNWKEAEQVWRSAWEEEKDAKARGRLAHNIAVAREKDKDLAGADEWINKALEDISGVGVKQYRKVLNVRLKEEPRLLIQLAEWEAGIANLPPSVESFHQN
jgi:hypothetical protein